MCTWLTVVKVAIGNKLYTAPIKNTGRVLDIGTGTGIWAMEMGKIVAHFCI